MTVFLANEQSEFSVDEDDLVALAMVVLEAEGASESELSILLVDWDAMTELNARFMEENRPTDVLAFPIDGPEAVTGPPGGPAGPQSHGGGSVHDDLDDDEDEDDGDDDDEPWLLGDVVLCPAYADKQAVRAGQSLAAELELLTVHGILHLCGLDHADPDQERVMKARTDELLTRWRTLRRAGHGGGGRGV